MACALPTEGETTRKKKIFFRPRQGLCSMTGDALHTFRASVARSSLNLDSNATVVCSSVNDNLKAFFTLSCPVALHTRICFIQHRFRFFCSQVLCYRQCARAPISRSSPPRPASSSPATAAAVSSPFSAAAAASCSSPGSSIVGCWRWWLWWRRRRRWKAPAPVNELLQDWWYVAFAPSAPALFLFLLLLVAAPGVATGPASATRGTR